MARLPSFFELGRECRDVFTKGYHVGLVNVEVQNSTCHGVDVKTSGTHIIENKTTVANVEVKANYPSPVNGLSSTHKWDLDNNLKTEVTYQNFVPGAKVTLEGRFNPDSGNKGGAVNAQFQHQKFVFDTKVDGADDSNLITGASLVAGHHGLLGAYKIDYDTATGDLLTNNIGFAYQMRDHNFLLAYDNLTFLNGFYYHRIRHDLELAAQAKILGAEDGTQLAVAGKYMFSGYGHTLRAKVNTKSILGLGLALKVVDGFQVCASADVDFKNFAAGNHKVGFGLDFGI